MHIREATLKDAECIKNVYMQAFSGSEAEMVSECAVNLLKENPPVKIISLVATNNNEVVGHIVFSPVFLEKSNEQIGYILAPLAVLPGYQKSNIGTALVNHGLDVISRSGSFIVFVYGDPEYYSRFGFTTDLARRFIPPYALQFPEGWHTLELTPVIFPDGGKIRCVDSLNDPNLW